MTNVSGTWSEYHTRSERAASKAQLEKLPLTRRLHYLAAARWEHRAWRALPRDKARTRGITGLSAICLYLKGGDRKSAAAIGRQFLHESQLPQYFKDEAARILGQPNLMATASECDI